LENINNKGIQGEFKANKAYKPRIKRIVNIWVIKRSLKEANYDHKCIWKAKEIPKIALEVREQVCKRCYNFLEEAALLGSGATWREPSSATKASGTTWPRISNAT
jgi:hypothetical protein